MEGRNEAIGARRRRRRPTLQLQASWLARSFSTGTDEDRATTYHPMMSFAWLPAHLVGRPHTSSLAWATDHDYSKGQHLCTSEGRKWPRTYVGHQGLLT